MDINAYDHIRTGGAGFIEMPRGLVAVSGKEAVQFLDGLITNDVKTLEDGGQMLAAFPNAKGRLLAVVRVIRQGERFLFETEEATREAVFQNLFRFTFAGDFLVKDLSESFRYFEIFGPPEGVFHAEAGERFAGAFAIKLPHGAGYMIPNEFADDFGKILSIENGCVSIDEELYETLRIESGIPKFGVDMDENTIVPELGIEEMISYSKGCYIGQEIIARIHFRGHVARKLAGLISEARTGESFVGAELVSAGGKDAGRITSATFSPKLGKQVSLAFVRYAFLDEGTMLRAADVDVEVVTLPFV